MKIYTHELDPKLEAICKALLFNNPLITKVDNLNDADAVVYHLWQIRDEVIPYLPEKLHIVLDLQDGYVTWTGTDVPKHVSHEPFFTELLSQNKFRNDVKYIIIKLQMHSYQLYQNTPDNIIILSMPLLLGYGYKQQQPPFQNGILDFENSVEARRNTFFDHIYSTNASYEYDCSIVNGSNPHRNWIFPIVNQFKHYSKQSDARSRLSIAETMDIHQKSKINISMNGQGWWCLKDCELLTHNCFDLRQKHPIIDINPLSPKNEKHWVIFENTPEDLKNKIEYYLQNDDERERIRHDGHQFIKECIHTLYSQMYGNAILDFVKTGSINAFGKLAVKNL
jgi:hypothetical protein